MGANIFSSLSGSYNYVNDMSNLISDYSSIKNGSYGSLMKSYVKKVGNKTALNAYRETGSTTTGIEASTSTNASTSTKKATASKSNFLDSHLGSIGKSTATDESSDTKKGFLDSHLDDVLGSKEKATYNKDATSNAAANATPTYDTTI
jgi:hypothetical protein